jgi:thiol-disulfide isomerase/thioredoxin
MKTRSLITIALSVAIVAAGAVWIRSLEPPPSPAGSLAFLSAVPSLPIADRSGRVTDLTEVKGKILIVHFWATWCPPCVEELPALSRFWEKYRGRDDIALYAISVDKDWKIVESFSAKNPHDLPLYLDPKAETAGRFGSEQYPETYIVNRNGRVLFRLQGAVNWSDPQVEQRIEQLLAS